MCEQPIDPTTPTTGTAPDQTAAPQPTNWKTRLREEVLQWIDQCPDQPLASANDSIDETPDLFSLYAELCAFRQLSDKTARRTHETLSGFNATLGQLDTTLSNLAGELSRQRMDRAGAIDEAALIRRLLDLADRTERLGAQLADPPPKKMFGTHHQWLEYLEKFSTGFTNASARIQELLAALSIERIKTIGQPFDPRLMMAVATNESSDVAAGTVLEEIIPGFTRNGAAVRFAEVTVSRRKDSQ